MKGTTTQQNLIAEIMNMAVAISLAEVEQVSTNLDGARKIFSVTVGMTWSIHLPLNHDELTFQLLVIRDRLDRLFDRIPEVAA